MRIHGWSCHISNMDRHSRDIIDTLYVVNTPSRITLWTHTLDNLCDTKVVALRTQSESTTDYTYNSKHIYPLELYYI